MRTGLILFCIVMLEVFLSLGLGGWKGFGLMVGFIIADIAFLIGVGIEN